MLNFRRLALAPLMALSLAACGSDADKAGSDGDAITSPSSKTLAAAIGDADELDALDAAIKNAGLSGVLDGKGPYTVFAPSNAVLTSAGSDFSGEQMKAQSAALLRAHIVPGALNRADIMAAIDNSGEDGVQMRTMADGLLTFSKDADTVVVTTADGASARLTGDEMVLANGVVQPVSALLMQAN